MSHRAKMYAPAVALALCALWIGLVGDGHVTSIVWLLVIAVAVVVQVREILSRRKRRGRI